MLWVFLAQDHCILDSACTACGSELFKDLVGYPLARGGCLCPGGWVCITNAIGRFINIVGLWPYGQLFCIAKRYYTCYIWRVRRKAWKIQNSDFSTYFCFYSQLFFNYLKWMKTLCLLFMDVSLEI